MSRKEARAAKAISRKIDEKSKAGKVPNLSGDERNCENCKYSTTMAEVLQALNQPGLPRDEVCCLHSPNCPMKKAWGFCFQHAPK